MRRPSTPSYPFLSKKSKALILGLGIVFILVIAFRHQIVHLVRDHRQTPMAWILYDGLSDDAFYYLKIANNILTVPVSSLSRPTPQARHCGDWPGLVALDTLWGLAALSNASACCGRRRAGCSLRPR
jgi:hypothetical protein